ncbi:N-acetylgalactosaminyltransferase 6 [Zeugodacus cucurbitae]|uniref:N-acetylgalactosaminyltransferase 6 n=1 Tax=Zeugodacus cucurbitae TaxID=28588 RepID=UPI0023D920F1|nr:N-acetylgalactosaminyltransferase 6 [Zeugodacus cucurbitae]
MRYSINLNIIRLLFFLMTSFVIFLLLSQWFYIRQALKEKETEIIQNTPFWQRKSNAELKDWHDISAMTRDAERSGLGEHGKAAYFTNLSKQKLQRELFKEHGFNALISDKISVNRSLPDIRDQGCQNLQYFADLPTASIIIPFYNEHLSTLLRSLHSIVNRTPPELIKEIILVDDFSDMSNLKKPLDEYVKLHLPKVEIIRFRKRQGLIAARIAGAVKAAGDVLVFMDSHVEANYNWLPPLLHEIVLNKRTAVCPMIDVIDDGTFEYTAQDEGARGAFDWILDYKRLPLLESDRKNRTKPFENPIMAGGLFAISREWFWELDGYDDGLDIWGGEQYELSFKIWMCGGRLLDVPCSRVGHIFRNDDWTGVTSDREDDYLHKNYKRVAEVWMDDYKYYLYKHTHGLYETINEGDLTKQLALREKLHCKSFKWFIENVAFDLVKSYPPRGITDFAFGQVRSLGAPKLCLDSMGPPDYRAIGVDACETMRLFPSRRQDWSLSESHDLRMRGEEYCLQTAERKPNSQLLLYDCSYGSKDQQWYYNRRHKWLVYGGKRHLCLEARPEFKQVVVNRCRKHYALMQWQFAHVNHTLLDAYFETLP